MNIELMVGAFAGALVLIVTALLTAFWRVWTDRERHHVDEVKRISDECSFGIGRIKQDLVDARLYSAALETNNARLEKENDAWRSISGTLRDRCSMLQVILDAKNIPVPEDRRNVTRPLETMLVEHLEKRKPKKE